MRHRIKLFGLLTITLVGLSCATSTPFNPFTFPEDQFYSKFKTIAMAPIAIPRDLENPLAQTKFEPLIEGKLREAGFEVIPSWRFQEMQFIARIFTVTIDGVSPCKLTSNISCFTRWRVERCWGASSQKEMYSNGCRVYTIDRNVPRPAFAG